MARASQTLQDFKGDHLSPKQFGASGDGVIIADAEISNGSTTLRSPSTPFTAGNASSGKIIAVAGAGPAGANLYTTIASFTDSGTIELSAAASTTVTSSRAIWGTDNLDAFASAISRQSVYGSRALGLYLPAGVFCLSGGISLPSGMGIEGRGRGATTLAFLAESGTSVASINAPDIHLKDFTLLTLVGNSANGLQVFGGIRPHIDIRVDGFNVGMWVTGDDGVHNTEDIWLWAPDIRNFRSVGFKCDHTTGLHAVQGICRTEDNNPFSAMGLLFDTGTSGIYIDQWDLEFCGWKIQNTSPSTNPVGYPPQFYDCKSVVADTCPTHGLHLDSSLNIDITGRAGKSLAFQNCWSAGTTVSGTDGFLVEGGQYILFSGRTKARVNRRHGIHIAGGEHVKIYGAYCVGNNFDDVANGAGLYVEGGTTGHVDIIGGEFSDNVAGDGSGKQKWGIYIKSDYSAPFSIIDPLCVGNQTGGISNNSSVSFQRILAQHDDAVAAALFNRIWFNKGRLEVGDGGFYLDFNFDAANAVSLAFDANLYFRCVRASNVLNLLVGAAGAGTLDIDATTLANIIQTRNICGFNLPPEIGWDVKTPAAKITTALRLAWLTSAGGLPLKASALGDVIAALIELTSADDVHIDTGVVPSGNALINNGGVVGDGGVPTSLPISDANDILKNAADATKLVKFDLSALATGTTRTVAVEDEDGVIAKGEALIGVLSGALVLTGSYADITGMSVTLTKKGKWLITISAQINSFSADNFPTVALVVAGSTQGGTIQVSTSVAGGETLWGTGQWIITSTTGSEVCKAQGKKVSGSGGSNVSGYSTITAVWVSP